LLKSWGRGESEKVEPCKKGRKDTNNGLELIAPTCVRGRGERGKWEGGNKAERSPYRRACICRLARCFEKNLRDWVAKGNIKDPCAQN